MSRFDRALIWPRLLAAALLLVALAGCGGGLYLTLGDSEFDSAPPSVSLATVSSASRGQNIRLAAAAADDFGIRQVTFYRDDGADGVLLGTDSGAPYESDTQIPADAVGTVSYFARATDFDGNVTQSTTVSVTVSP
jgi:hypothetical protein